MTIVMLDYDPIRCSARRATAGPQCEVLAQFVRAGIGVDALATHLQDEGAKSFVKSWNDLMAVITFKSAALKGAVAG